MGSETVVFGQAEDTATYACYADERSDGTSYGNVRFEISGTAWCGESDKGSGRYSARRWSEQKGKRSCDERPDWSGRKVATRGVDARRKSKIKLSTKLEL